MREIKFRVWNPEFKIMSEVFTLEDVLFGRTLGCDKNGKEIYEGDILDMSEAYFTEYQIVEWINDGFKLRSKNYSPDSIYRNFSHDNVEIVGNIYENPELLESRGSDEKI
jgi:uncharacterized phage protein (TIGR01671 family)